MAARLHLVDVIPRMLPSDVPLHRQVRWIIRLSVDMQDLDRWRKRLQGPQWRALAGVSVADGTSCTRPHRKIMAAHVGGNERLQGWAIDPVQPHLEQTVASK